MIQNILLKFESFFFIGQQIKYRRTDYIGIKIYWPTFKIICGMPLQVKEKENWGTSRKPQHIWVGICNNNVVVVGSVQATKILQEITTKSPTRAAKYQAALKRVLTFTPAEISGDIALATIIKGVLLCKIFEKSIFFLTFFASLIYD